MKGTFRWKISVLLLTVIVFVFLNNCADAAVVGERIPDSTKDPSLHSIHNIVKRHWKLHNDKQYGDGSLKKFFFMLKIILTLFGKH